MNVATEHLFCVEVHVSRQRQGGVAIEWSWPGGGFSQELSPDQVDDLDRRFRNILTKMQDSQPVSTDLEDFGRRLGRLAIGSFGEELVTVLHIRHQRFALGLISGDDRVVTSLPWETLHLPGADRPLFALPEVRGGFDIARVQRSRGAISGRRAAHKCLAAWATSPQRHLMVEAEVKELRDRLEHHPSIRFRWVMNPDLYELSARLNLECTLFLFSGHGQLLSGSYHIELSSGLVEAQRFSNSLRTSRAEMLVFDSCDSGCGGSETGLPALLESLPSATCLLGIQGPGNDVVSCWYMPALVERVLIGQPIWMSVNLLRLLLYDQGLEAWFQPVIHIKRNYRPFDIAKETREYLSSLSWALEGRRDRHRASHDTVGKP